MKNERDSKTFLGDQPILVISFTEDEEMIEEFGHIVAGPRYDDDGTEYYVWAKPGSGKVQFADTEYIVPTTHEDIMERISRK